MKRKREQAQARMDRVGNYILETLAQNNLDIGQLSLDQLDGIVRHLQLDTLSHQAFTNYYFRWLEKRMKIAKEQVDLLRASRNEYRVDVKRERYQKNRHNDNDDSE